MITAPTFFYIIVGILVFNYVLERVLEWLDDRRWSDEVPPKLQGIYDEEKYRKSQAYDRAKSRFGLVSSTFSIVLMLTVLLLDGFAWIDHWARGITEHPTWLAILFFGVIAIASDVLSMPFSIYGTFVLEERFGFNKTTGKTFVLDRIKGYVVGALIGGGLLALIVWLYHITGPYFWLLAWGVVTVVLLLTTMFYASVLLPLFNKLTPLEEGELRAAIQAYCDKVGFRLDNLFVMDGSKRSAKANAFFSGLGSRKKIVLYDTLIEKHTTEELVAVLAHEIGHYKKKHTLWSVLLSILQVGLMLFIFSLFIGNTELCKALGVEEESFHISILAFSMLYAPLSMILGIGMNMLSRKNEYEADAYAKATYNGEALQSALKKLSVNNLSNLNPHPLNVFIGYSHPTLLQRLEALEKG